MDLKNLTTEQVSLIIAALDVVTPSGGSSPQFQLSNEIRRQSGLMAGDFQVRRLMKVVMDEAMDANIISYYSKKGWAI